MYKHTGCSSSRVNIIALPDRKREPRVSTGRGWLHLFSVIVDVYASMSLRLRHSVKMNDTLIVSSFLHVYDGIYLSTCGLNEGRDSLGAVMTLQISRT